MTTTSEFLSPDGPQRLLSDLCRTAADRATAEREVTSGFSTRTKTTEKKFAETERSLVEQHRTRKAAIEAEYTSARETVESRFRSEEEKVKKQYEDVRAKILLRFAAEQKAVDQSLQNSKWDAVEASDAARGGLNLPLEDMLTGLDERWRQLESIHKEAAQLMEQRGHWSDLPPAPPTNIVLEKHPGRRFCLALEQAQKQHQELSRQRLPRWFRGFRPLGVFFLLWILAIGPAIGGFGPKNWVLWLSVSFGVALLIAVVAGTWIARISRRKSVESYLALRRTMLEAGVGVPNVLETAKNECRQLDTAIQKRFKTQTQKAEECFTAATARIERRRDDDLQQAEESFPKRLAELTAWRDQARLKVEEKYPPLLRQLEEHFTAELKRIRENRDATAEEDDLRRERAWNELSEKWFGGLDRIFKAADETDRLCREQFPDWDGDDWSRWKLANAIPPAVPIGRGLVKLSALKDGVPQDERLRPPRDEFPLPVFLPFPQRSLLLMKTSGPGRAKAIDLMQSVMLRLLSAMPPGKVRFTIIDPVGLGDNFSAFMHLADFDEKLVASRIWTDSAHIEQHLIDLTKHMENVIQVYLRQEFHSIEEYNASAGEMAEPYRVLIVANFPANFSDAAVQRIKSIAASGARCGVFVVMSVDAKTALPRNIQPADLENNGLVLRWADERFIWEHPEFGPLAVEFSEPPPPERFKEIVLAVGSAARDAGHVEVPFSHIVPEPQNYWTFDSRAGIDVPLGRAGAMKLQDLALGSGTSQHVVISGKTGSGKSTLLHVLITNMALRYSPDDIELYLIDFKKGVEFKAYAKWNLPHARVIAIESEREFGLSVLQRLDDELRVRGDMFRSRGLQDLKGFRNANPDARLPRIMLIIDEFQELFTEDDRIAADSTLLLDRLVRQGRAFGIHVLLGSQTLGGAYTLARSTLGQMAVRIALQCSEADAHLILSEDNTAARLLNRPGEAIYNDANGLYEGNHPFQIVWLSDSERDHYLEAIDTLRRERRVVTPPSIVFEGNVLADPTDNVALHGLLESPTWAEPDPITPAWLGSAVAIKDPTAAMFQRQSGSNLLIVGHREEASLGVLSTCFVSLAARYAPGRVKFYILDGMRADAPEVGTWQRLQAAVPQEVKIAGIKETPEALAEVAAELAARQQSGAENAPPIFIFLYNLGRFRDLRKEDDYGFSSDDGQSASPAKQFVTLLREGPPQGIHSLVWCDTYTNVNRQLDRRNLQDFEMRVLFQMNATDSSSLMDSPEASRLGVHRAVLYDEGQGVMEKFRPYGIPSPKYLAWVKERLSTKAGV